MLLYRWLSDKGGYQNESSFLHGLNDPRLQGESPIRPYALCRIKGGFSFSLDPGPDKAIEHRRIGYAIAPFFLHL